MKTVEISDKLHKALGTIKLHNEFKTFNEILELAVKNLYSKRMKGGIKR